MALFTARPEGETDFGFASYRRELWQCGACGHVLNHHQMPLERLYDSAYAEATYGDHMAERFETIMAMPAGKSDNHERVARVNAYVDSLGITAPRRALDVGCGLGVFPAALAASGWDCLGIEPDQRAVSFLRDHVGIAARCGDFVSTTPEASFDLISLNKVLEHVPDPVTMLARAGDWLNERGVVYVELPDAEAALADSPAREEFFIEHYAAYSVASLAMLAWQAGLRAERIERLRECSGKYSLAAFLRRP
ncbi:MAG: class I SAM-dependent methyltransferase [Alphaproteobacteria bacterium]|nr:class I SAM-dependent methyltransferase [Alphaproteobacteria bacterium]